jgi:CheY-like chemotaxis protein
VLLLKHVQDDVINSKILGKRMLMDGHTVVHAANGQECVDIIRTDHEFDCILMDIQYVVRPVQT